MYLRVWWDAVTVASAKTKVVISFSQENLLCKMLVILSKSWSFLVRFHVVSSIEPIQCKFLLCFLVELSNQPTSKQECDPATGPKTGDAAYRPIKELQA